MQLTDVVLKLTSTTDNKIDDVNVDIDLLRAADNALSQTATSNYNSLASSITSGDNSTYTKAYDAIFNKSNIVISIGDHTEAASGTAGSSQYEGMYHDTTKGMYMTQTYKDTAIPCHFGNIINLAGKGTGQLLCEWSGTDNVTGSLYYRSHRDTTGGGWSNWGKIPVLISNYRSGANWYRVWSDGWIEQGGPMSTSSTITLHVAMSDTNYYVDVTWNGGKSSNFYPADWKIQSLTTTSFSTTATSNGSNVKGSHWYVCGY